MNGFLGRQTRFIIFQRKWSFIDGEGFYSDVLTFLLVFKGVWSYSPQPQNRIAAVGNMKEFFFLYSRSKCKVDFVGTFSFMCVQRIDFNVFKTLHNFQSSSAAIFSFFYSVFTYTFFLFIRPL